MNRIDENLRIQNLSDISDEKIFLFYWYLNKQNSANNLYYYEKSLNVHQINE